MAFLGRTLFLQLGCFGLDSFFWKLFSAAMENDILSSWIIFPHQNLHMMMSTANGDLAGRLLRWLMYNHLSCMGYITHTETITSMAFLPLSTVNHDNIVVNTKKPLHFSSHDNTHGKILLILQHLDLLHLTQLHRTSLHLYFHEVHWMLCYLNHWKYGL